MLINKAFEILQLNIKEAGKKMPPDTLTALKMANSALHRILTMRSYNIDQALFLLKGESIRNAQNLPETKLKNIRESPLGKEPGS